MKNKGIGMFTVDTKDDPNVGVKITNAFFLSNSESVFIEKLMDKGIVSNSETAKVMYASLRNLYDRLTNGKKS